MTHFLKTLLFVFTVVVFISCQRDFSPTDTPIPPVTNDTGNLLTKYFEIDSVPGIGLDTNFIAKFTYDDRKRLTHILTTFSNDPANAAIFFEETKFNYNGIDTLPFQIIIRNQTGTNPDHINKDTGFYFYDASARLIKDSTRMNQGSNPVQIKKNEYHYETGFVLRTVSENNDTRTDTAFQTFQNGNLISQDLTERYSMQTRNYNFSYSYDTNPNPFYITALVKIKPVAADDDNTHNTISLNNKTVSTHITTADFISTDTTTIQCNYTYKSNRYPSVVYKIYDSGSSDVRYTKGVFVY